MTSDQLSALILVSLYASVLILGVIGLGMRLVKRREDVIKRNHQFRDS
jgi:hypothetical protein